MALPKVPLPKYTTELPISKQKVTYRPFTVREEKLLLLAKELKDQTEILKNTLQIVDLCTFEKLDLNAMALVDLEWLFLRLRAKSVGETSELKFSCLNMVDDKQCNADIDVSINLEEIELDREVPDTKIELSKDVGIVLKFPDVDLIVNSVNLEVKDIDTQIKMIFDLVEYIYDADNVYPKADISLKEFDEWVESLHAEQFEKIEKFFSNFPKLSKKIHLTCPKCGNETDLTLEGLQDFF